MIKFLDLYSQYVSMRAEIDAAIERTIRQSAFVGGAAVREFEQQFAEYQSATHCVGVANGTDAIEIAFEALGLPKGSEVIVPANSFIASSEAVTRAGYRVVFADVDDTYTLNPDDVARRITSRTSAIVAVHLYGQPCDMPRLLELAGRHGLKVLEDAAQAHGAEVGGKRVGALGHVGTFSFYPGKNLGAYGDAGAIVTHDSELAARCRMIANHGRIDKYNHQFEGRNSRLDGLQAAILSVKLKHLPAWIDRRNAVAKRYFERLSGTRDIVLPTVRASLRHAYHLFVIRSARREALAKFLDERGIQTGVHYPISLPRLAAYAYLGQQYEKSNANRWDSELLSLPMGEHLTDAQVDEVAEAIAAFYH